MPSNRTEYLDHLVGVERQIEEIESLLSLRLNTVCIVGIWGTGGIGKTTLASAVYHKISYQFEDSYFITNVRDCGKPNWFQRNKFSTEILCHKKLLFVLDDVSTHTEIDFLIGSYDSLNLGSRIIIISRDRHVLYNCRANYIYKVNGLFDEEARKLFSLCAFKRNHPTEDYMELSYMLVRHAKGIPLVLKVLGVSLYGKRRREWESALSQLRRGLNRDIYDVLKISYDGLDDEEKKIFLDIVCFFVGEHKDYVEIFLNSKGFSTTGINVLMDKSLISLSNNKIVVHDLIQELGWDIAHQEYFNRVAGKPSFWWHHKDIGFVLGKNVRVRILIIFI
ncbi:hypothetical protein Ddye_003875 [Dipteronia dyeriana]|uniref:NB-ARC domain-containing protein n=1 Tax=Dipteronia dyeriana TaxID=168575 RepID=A0AAD9TD27_9ROSI|nr:hypothetical protein Ddye_032427 [Dipteronia dyeriana]KAK2665301.1 hypothetical protein Ddye_003875 [Dipteronia dyeriana]